MVPGVTSSEKNSESLANKKPRLVIYEGMDSLARWHDGLNYLATVLKVKSCLWNDLSREDKGFSSSGLVSARLFCAPNYRL